jgi:peptide/nickel transport system permease protein
LIRLVVDRLGQMILVLILVTGLGYFLINLLTGDVVTASLGDQATPQAIAALRTELHLDDPIWERYLRWLGSALRGDFGTSLSSNQAVGQAIRHSLGPTVELLIGAQVVGVFFGVLTTAIAVRWRALDRLITFLGLLANSVPAFVTSLFLIIIFASTFRLLPSVAWADPATEGLGPNLKGMIMPWFALGLSIFPEYMRVFRSDIQEQLDNEEYVTLARMKGLKTRRVLGRHVARNSLGGLVTLVGLTTGLLISGVVIVERVFVIPGIGSLVFRAIDSRDSVLLEGLIVLIATSVVVINFVAELIQMQIDPRVRPAEAQ